MKLTETGFRALYHHFCVFPLNARIKVASADFEGINEADSVLLYGYIDREAGLTLEIIALACRKNGKYRFFDPNNEISAFVRAEVLKDEEFEIQDDVNGELSDRFSEKISMLSSYNASEEVEAVREMDFLDASRDEQFIDDVIVYLVKDGCRPEGCWARICGLSENKIFGVLLNEPYQNFGLHAGDKIPFGVEKQDGGTVICVSFIE